MRLCDQRSIIRLRVVRRTNLQAFDARNQFLDKNVGSFFTDGDRDRDRHAALAAGAIPCADQSIDSLVDIGIRHDNHMVLRAAKALNPFAVGAPGRIDVLSDRRRADEADRHYAWIGQQRIHCFLVTVDHVEYSGRKPCIDHQFGQPYWNRRVAFGWLKDESIAARDRRREFPHRDHCRKIERRDAGDNP
jgi:hypothetical protein